MWAESGFPHLTTKEIAKRAGTSMSSINFHFGGREGLRRAVLAEARLQVVRLRESVATALPMTAGPLEKLGAFVDLLLGVEGRDPTWGLHVLAREAVLSSGADTAPIGAMCDLLHPVLEELLELPAGHPDVARAAGWVMQPMLACLVAQSQGHASRRNQDLLHYFAGGLHAMREAHRQQP